MKTRVILLAMLAALALMGCAEKKMEPIPVGEMQEYRDPGFGWSISYPKNWPTPLAEVGRARFYNERGVDQKFTVPNEPGTLGAEIKVTAVKTGEAADFIAKAIAEMKSGGYKVEPEEKVTINGVAGTKVKYGANYGKNSIIYGHNVYLPVDSTVYELGFAGFEQFYAACVPIFDASLNTFKPAAAKVPGRDETLPSDVFTPINGKSFSFEAPENFNSTNPAKGKYEEVAELRSDKRLDCSIKFDVQPAKGLTLEKVFEQNKGLLRGGVAGKATVGGENAMTLTGSVTKDVQRRFYFVVRNDKIFRITTDWYKPQTEAYNAAFGKVIASVKFK